MNSLDRSEKPRGNPIGNQPMLQLQTLLKHHPWRFLLYLEWILLLMIALSEAIPLPFSPISHNALVNWSCLILFTGMGIRLPKTKGMKICYTGLEIGLILLASVVGGIHLFPLLYIVLVIRNSLLFRRSLRLIILIATFILFLLTLHYRLKVLTLSSPIVLHGFSMILLSLVSLMGIVMVFSQLLVERALSERQNREQLAVANAQLESANRQLRQYALRIEDMATLQERNRIAREIHDALGHSLTVFNLHLEAALRLWDTDPTEAKDLLTEAKQLGGSALKDVRQSVAALRADPLQGQSLTGAIASLITDFQRSTRISPTSTLEFEEPLPQEIKTTTYRIVQEALTNICKYAEATAVQIRITATDRLLQILVADNGKGFNLDHNTTGFGLQGMQERSLALGGKLEIVTAPGTGCRVMAELPF